MLVALEEARLVSRDHVLDRDVGFFAAVALQDLEGLSNELRQVHVLLLAIVHLVAQVFCVSCGYWFS